MKMRCFLFSLVFISASLVLYSQDISKDTLHLKEVVVSGTKTEVIRNNIPMTISIVNEKEIENSNESALLPVISERVPGVFVTERGVTGFGVASGSAGQISIRGVGGSPNTQVLMLLDGHPQYMGIMGHPLPDSYVSSDVDRVEIIKGPASILYGSGAMGGVINIITKKQKQDGFSLKGKVSYGSFNTQKYMGSAGYKKDKLSVFASYNHDQTDGHRENSKFKIDNAYAKVSYELTENIKSTIDFNVAKFYTCDPGPVGTTDSTFLNNGHWIDILRGKASFTVENNYDKMSGAVKVFHNFGEHILYDGFHSNDINTGVMVYESFKLFNGNSTTVGVDYKTFGGIAENTEAMMGAGMIFGDTTLTETGAYVMTQQSIKQKLIINAGVRSEYHSVYGNQWIPQAGLSYNINTNSTIKGIASKGFRSPTIRELYLWMPANADLKPEELMNYEISYLQRVKSKLNFELNCFYITGENMIKTVFEGGVPKHMNTGEFTNTGIEFATNYRLNKNLKFHLNYSYLHMDTPIIASPEHQGYFSATYKWNKISVSANTQYIHGLYTSVAQNNIVKENYLLLNARVNYKLNNYVDFYVAGNNLLNTNYEINYLYPMPGINIFAGINLQLNKLK